MRIACLHVPDFRLQARLRGVAASGVSLVGGGARYQVYDSGLIIAIPDVAVTVGYDKLSHDVIGLKHFGASVQASFNIPILKPFIGFGFDNTTLELKQATDPVLTALLPLEGKKSGTRLTIGANLTLIPFTYLYGAYHRINGQGGASFGLGVRFGGIL